MQTDMTRGKIWRLMLDFALPIMLGMLLQMLYNTVDGIVVGNAVGEAALGAVNTSGSYANLLLACATGLSTGAGIILSQYYGAGKTDKLHSTLSTLVWLMLGLGLVFLVLGELTITPVLRHVLGVPEDTFAFAKTYLAIYFLGMVFQFLYNGLAAALRSVGNSRSTLLFLVISSAANILLDLLFVVGLRWGVAGAAIATVFSQGLSVAVCIWYIYRRQPLLALHKGELSFRRADCGLILKTGIPVAVQTMISSTGNVFMQRLINRFGTSFMAGLAAASRVESYAIVPTMSFGQAMSVFAGQNAGAGDLKRVRQGLTTALVMTLALSVTISGCIILFARPLVGLFGCEAEALEYGVTYLRFMAAVLVIAAVLFVARGMLQGMGDVTVCLAITFGTLAFRVIIAYIMAGTVISYRAIWYAMGLDFVVGTGSYIVRLLGGKWKNKVVVH